MKIMSFMFFFLSFSGLVFFFSRFFPIFVKRIWKRTRWDGSDSRPSPNMRGFFVAHRCNSKTVPRLDPGTLNAVLLFWEEPKITSNFVRLYQKWWRFQLTQGCVWRRCSRFSRSMIQVQVERCRAFEIHENGMFSIERASGSTDPVHTSGGCHYSDGIPDVYKWRLCWNIWDD